MPVRTTAPDHVPGVSPYLRDLLSNRQEHVDAVRERLFRIYGYPEPGERADPLSDLIATILSQHTSDVNSHRAFARLRAHFPSWEQVATAPVEEGEEAIRPAGLAVQTAPPIR